MRAAPSWWSVSLSPTFYHERGGEAMDTNQIAAAVQGGQSDVLDLWAAVRRFAHNRAYRWYRAMDGRAGMVLEDYIQVAFLALLDALEGWKPDEGAFLTWYGLRLKSAFAEAAGQRTQREKRDPLQSYVSLDMPATDNESDALTLGDVLPDPEAEKAIEDIAERDLHRALYRALHTLSVPQRRAVVLRYCYGFTLDETAAKVKITKATASAAVQKGLRLLRHPKNSRELRTYM